MSELRDYFINKIKTLNETIWDDRANGKRITQWLNNFTDNFSPQQSQELHALHLLSQFAYFSSAVMRELLKALFRDLIKYPIIKQIRKDNNNTTNLTLINSKYVDEISKTRFLGMGNPSESGSHLLFYFRQENDLPKTLFIYTHEIIKIERKGGIIKIIPNFPEVKRYIFIDDLCGSGSQAERYSRSIVNEIKTIQPDAKIYYYVLVATSEGLQFIRNNTRFDNADCIYELNHTYRCFDDNSRYFVKKYDHIEKEATIELCYRYGIKLYPMEPFGFNNGQLLIGFHQNTPDNTLPIFWYGEKDGFQWKPIFRRYQFCPVNWLKKARKLPGIC